MQGKADVWLGCHCQYFSNWVVQSVLPSPPVNETPLVMHTGTPFRSWMLAHLWSLQRRQNNGDVGSAVTFWQILFVVKKRIKSTQFCRQSLFLFVAKMLHRSQTSFPELQSSTTEHFVYAKWATNNHSFPDGKQKLFSWRGYIQRPLLFIRHYYNVCKTQIANFNIIVLFRIPI